MIKLTEDNYYTPGTKALTHSKIKDFAICPNYFYRKHVLNEIEQGPASDAFITGTVVDKLLSGEQLSSKYTVVKRRTEKLKAEAAASNVILLLQTQENEIIELAAAIEDTDAFKVIKENSQMQTILQVEDQISEHWDSRAGKPDFFWIDGKGVCFLIDLKTSKTADPRQYYWHAMGYRYDSQLAMYKMLLGEKYLDKISEVRCFNLVVSKQRDVYDVELFEFPTHTIDRATNWINYQIDAIRLETEYTKYNPSFDAPKIFGDYADTQTTSTEDSGDSGE